MINFFKTVFRVEESDSCSIYKAVELHSKMNVSPRHNVEMTILYRKDAKTGAAGWSLVTPKGSEYYSWGGLTEILVSAFEDLSYFNPDQED